MLEDVVKRILHIKAIRKFGYWFFCAIGDPIFSPSRAMIGDVVCIWCDKRHGTLAKER